MRIRNILIVGLAGGLSVVLSLVYLYRAVDTQAERDETRTADAIIVLGSQVQANGQPSFSLRARTQRAIELYKEGYAPVLFLTGGLGRFPPAEAQAMRRLALAAGIPDTALILDETATSTQESMTTAARVAQERGWRTVLIVSDPFHMLRARQMARDVGLNAYGAPAYQSQLYTVAYLRRFYTGREAVALLWYYTLGRLTATTSLVHRGVSFLGVQKPVFLPYSTPRSFARSENGFLGPSKPPTYFGLGVLEASVRRLERSHLRPIRQAFMNFDKQHRHTSGSASNSLGEL